MIKINNLTKLSSSQGKVIEEKQVWARWRLFFTSKQLYNRMIIHDKRRMRLNHKVKKFWWRRLLVRLENHFLLEHNLRLESKHHLTQQSYKPIATMADGKLTQSKSRKLTLMEMKKTNMMPKKITQEEITVKVIAVLQTVASAKVQLKVEEINNLLTFIKSVLENWRAMSLLAQKKSSIKSTTSSMRSEITHHQNTTIQQSITTW